MPQVRSRRILRRPADRNKIDVQDVFRERILPQEQQQIADVEASAGRTIGAQQAADSARFGDALRRSGVSPTLSTALRGQLQEDSAKFLGEELTRRSAQARQDIVNNPSRFAIIDEMKANKLRGIRKKQATGQALSSILSAIGSVVGTAITPISGGAGAVVSGLSAVGGIAGNTAAEQAGQVAQQRTRKEFDVSKINSEAGTLGRSPFASAKFAPQGGGLLGNQRLRLNMDDEGLP